MQQEQLKVLSDISGGAEFKFVPADKNKFGIKYYEHKCKTDDEYFDVSGRLSYYDDIVYRCIEYPDKTASVIVLENKLDATKYDNIRENRIDDLGDLKPIGKINGNDVFVEPILTMDGKAKTVVANGGRAIAVVNINGRRLPFYVSSGMAGKEKEYGIPSGKWYALQGISEGGWLNKMPNMMNNPYPELDKVCELLERKFPAAKLKQDALQNSIPLANMGALLQAANNEFPEGMPFNSEPSYKYVKNHCVYLPQVINTWREKPTDFLHAQSGFLAAPGQETLNKIQKMNLLCESRLEGDSIWFYPVNAPGQSGLGDEIQIENELRYKLGINFWIQLTQPNKAGFGVPINQIEACLEQQRQRQEQKQQQFKMAANRVEQAKPAQKQSTTFQSIVKKMGDLFKD